MTIKQQGGIFGRNPTFNEVDVQTNVSFSDNAKALFGNSSDLAVYHNGSNSIIEDTGSGNLFIQGTHVYIKDASGNNFARFYDNGTGGQIRLYHDASKVFETNSSGISITGNVAVTSGNGIDFSATSGTGTSELFDDYEEGTWTPQDSGASDIGSGTYTKVGRLVTLHGLITSNSVSTTTIGNLPFTIGTAYYGGFWTRTYGGDTVSNSQNCRIVALSGSALSLKTNVTTGTDANFTFTTDAAGTVRTSFTAMYEV